MPDMPIQRIYTRERLLPERRSEGTHSVKFERGRRRSIEILPELLPGLPALEVLSPNDTQPARP